MVVICSMDVLVKDGKISNEAKGAIDALEKTDKLILISKNGNITVNTETLNFLIHVKCPIEVSEYANTNAMILNIGMELAKAQKLKIVMKTEDAAILKDLLKGNEKVSFGWSEGRAKKKEQSAIKEIKEAPKAAVKKESKEPAEKKEETAKEGKVRKTKKKAEAPVKENKEPVSIEQVKGVLSGKYTKKDWESITAVINEASDSDLGLDFLCKIKLPILYQKDENFAEKMKEAYKALKG